MSQVSDLRDGFNLKHNLVDILTIAVFAVLSGVETWDDMELYGKERHSLLKKFLELPAGIPSHDTFNRVFALLNPKSLEEPEFTEIWPVSVSSGPAYQLLFAWIHYVTIKQTQSIKLRKRGSTSPVCTMWRLHNSPAGFEPTGRLRTNYTGCWIWPSMKIPVRRELVTRLKTFLDYFGSHDTSLNTTRIRTQRSCPTGQ